MRDTHTTAQEANATDISRRSFIGLAGGLAALTACGGLGIRPGMVLAADNDTVIIQHSGDPMSWNPDTTADDYAYPIEQNMFHRLTKLDASKKAIPDAAESWDVSDDALTITFHLREDLYWSDGEPLTAEDCVYTFETIKEHAEYYLSATVQNVDSFVVVDDHTLEFHLAQPDMSIVSTVGWYAGFILPKHVYDVEGVSWEDNEAALVTGTPVTSGPYRLESYVQGQSITLVANEDYYKVPVIKRLVYSIISDDATSVQALENAEIDVLETVPSANAETLLANPELRLILNEYPSPARIIFNVTRSDLHLDDPVVRRAIAMCIDRDSISQKAFAGIMPPETHFYPSLYSEYSNDVDVCPEYDPEGAKQLLEDAGYAADENGFYITGLTIDAFTSSNYDQCAKLIAAAMTDAGIECSLNSMEYNAWSEKVSQQRDFGIELQGGFMGPDAYALKNRLGTGVAANYGGYSNEEFDALCDQANATADDEERAELYKQAQAILAEDLPYLPICAFAAYDAYAVGLQDTPIDGTDKWGWQEWTYASWA